MRKFKNSIMIMIFLFCIYSCLNKTDKENSINHITTAETIDSTSIKNHLDSMQTIFEDSNFSYLSLDSINEEMFESEISNKKYSDSLKKFKKEHCDFFKKGCSGTFWDDYVFLVSKQAQIGTITPIIIHESSDFNFYHSDLYTIDLNYRIIDKITVSLDGFVAEGETNYSKIYKTKSRFINDTIVITTTNHRKYDDGTITLEESNEDLYLIHKDGKIIKL